MVAEVNPDYRSMSPLTISSSDLLISDGLLNIRHLDEQQHGGNDATVVKAKASPQAPPPSLPVVSPPSSPTTTKVQVKPASQGGVTTVRKKRAYRKSKPSTNHAKRQLPHDFQPTSYSVICGRGKECFDSEGNKRFREIINKFLDDYAAAPGKSEKSAIVSKAMNIIREASPQGAFVKCENGIWFEVSTRYAREKVGAWFRDCLHNKYKSSSKAKHARKMAKRVSYNALDPDEIMNFPLDVEFDDLPELDDKFYDEVDRREGLDKDSNHSSSSSNYETSTSSGGEDDESGSGMDCCAKPEEEETTSAAEEIAASTREDFQKIIDDYDDEGNHNSDGFPDLPSLTDHHPATKLNFERHPGQPSFDPHPGQPSFDRHPGQAVANAITSDHNNNNNENENNHHQHPTTEKNHSNTFDDDEKEKEEQGEINMDEVAHPADLGDALNQSVSNGTFYDIDDISLTLVPFDVDDDL